MGNVYGETMRNIAGMGVERDFAPSYSPRETLFDVGIGSGLALLPGGSQIAGKASGIGMPRNYYWQLTHVGLFTEKGSLRAIYNPLKPSGRYFYASTVFDSYLQPAIEWWFDLPKYY
jgi:hypothetical protein